MIGSISAVASVATVAASLAGTGFLLPGAQWFGATVRTGRRRGNEIALTFDDGPSDPWTGRLLDVLAQTGTPAAFFVLGINANRHPGLLKRMVTEGHLVANHSYSHSPYASLTGRLFDEVVRTDEVIHNATGLWPRFARPPYGHKTPWFLHSLRRTGRVPVMWNVAAADWRARDPEALARSVTRRARPGGIVLLHDGDGASPKADRRVTVAAVPRIVEQLRQRDFKLVSLPTLLDTAAYREAPVSSVTSTGVELS